MIKKNRYAILIANSKFPKEKALDKLKSPVKDVNGIKAILASPSRGNFTSIKKLINKEKQNITETIEGIFQKASKDDFILIYYSGHGKTNPNKELYLTTHNTDYSLLSSTTFKFSDINEYIKASNCKRVVVILDCCYSGSAKHTFSKNTLEDQLEKDSDGIWLLTASSSANTAEEKHNDKYSVFTKHIIEGIQTGRADKDSKGIITIGSLFNYAREETIKESSQNPKSYTQDVVGEIIISKSGKIPLLKNTNERLKKHEKSNFLVAQRQDNITRQLVTKDLTQRFETLLETISIHSKFNRSLFLEKNKKRPKYNNYFNQLDFLIEKTFKDIEQYKTSEYKERVYIADMIKAIIDTAKIQYIDDIEKGDLNIFDDIFSEPYEISIFSYSMHNVLHILIENGIDSILKKGKGKLTITVKHKNNELKISVKDTGNGITKEHQKKLFTSHLIDDENTYNSSLVRIKEIVENEYAGKLLVKSEEGVGSVFTISLPLK